MSRGCTTVLLKVNGNRQLKLDFRDNDCIMEHLELLKINGQFLNSLHCPCVPERTFG